MAWCRLACTLPLGEKEGTQFSGSGLLVVKEPGAHQGLITVFLELEPM